MQTIFLIRIAKLVLLWLAATHLCIAGAQNQPASANFILGGGFAQCGSFNGLAAGQRCAADWPTILANDPAFAGWSIDDLSLDSRYVPPAFSYSLTASTLERLRRSPAHLIDSTRRAAVLRALEAQLEGEPTVRGVAWEAVMEAVNNGPGWPQEVTLQEESVLRNALVDKRAMTNRRKEAVSIALSAVAPSKEIYTAFVAAARAANGGQSPTIGVVTASADSHPFVNHDANMSALRSAGANTVYLAFDGGMRRAIDRNDCVHLPFYSDHYANANKRTPLFHSHLAYPDVAALQLQQCEQNAVSLNATLERLSGVFFAGGDQGRHLESLLTQDATGNFTQASTQLEILRKRFAAGQLVVAGSSAGNHIQGGGVWRGKPVPMLDGGDSYDVLRTGHTAGRGVEARLKQRTSSERPDPANLYAQGGLGVFHYGVLDSHFSQRTREGRLTRATLESGMDYGFGVDENTALVVSRPDSSGTTRFSVMGAGGVWMVDVRQADAKALPGGLAIDGARAHYLRPGDTARIDSAGALHITLTEANAILPVTPGAPTALQDGIMDYGSTNFLKLANTMGQSGAPLGYGSTQRSTDRRSRQTDPYYSVTLRRDGFTQFRGMPGTGVSYTGLLLQFSPCQGTCHAP